MSEKVFQTVDPRASLRERFEFFARNFVQYIVNNKEYYLFMEQVSNSPLLRNWCLEDTTPMYQPLFELYEEGKQQKLFQNEDLNLLVMYSIAPIAQLAKEQLTGQFQFDQNRTK